jgi:hypothetical protein
VASDPNGVDVELATTLADLRAVAIWSVIRAHRFRLAWSVAFLAFVPLFVAVGAALARSGSGSLAGALFGMALGLGAYLIFATYLTTWATPRRNHRAVLALGPTRLRVRPNGVEIRSAVAESLVAWSSIDRYCDTKRFYALVLPNRSVICIPRAPLAEGDDRALAATFARHLAHSEFVRGR